MLAGMIYDANYDSGLISERLDCKEKCRDYNDLRPKDTTTRENLLREILGEVKGSILIEQPFYCDYGYNIRVGENFYANFSLVILDEAPVTFGDNVFIAPNCGFYTAGHPKREKQRPGICPSHYSRQQCMDRRAGLCPSRSDNRR